MKKILWICLILWALGMCGEQAQARDIVEKWQCFARSDYRKNSVLVELSGRMAAGEKWGRGQVVVGGVRWNTVFALEGFDKRWDFGEELRYGFIIEPDGTGKYLDFEGSVRGVERVLPHQIYNCVSP